VLSETLPGGFDFQLTQVRHAAMISMRLLADFTTLGPLALVSGLLILGGLAFFAMSLYAAIRAMHAAYLEQGRRFSRCRLTGREAVGRLLTHVGLPSDAIEVGAKIDHYDQLRRRVKLRTESSVASSVAALAIAAHEVGHAEQFAKGYWAARATSCLLVLAVAGAAVLLVYPFANAAFGAGDVNLTSLVALAALVALLRLPFALALERDATRRGERLLRETNLAHETEQEGIAHFLRTGFRVHVLGGVAIVLLIGAGVGIMWLVENGLSSPTLTDVQVAVESAPAPGQPLLQIDAINVDEGYAYPIAALIVAIATVWWAFSGKSRKTPARSAPDANNEGMARFHAGDPAGALALINEALRQDPGLAAAHFNRAVVLMSQGRKPEALASIDSLFACRAEDAEPLIRTADFWFMKGTLKLDQEDYQGAIDDLSRALELDPVEPATALLNRGLAWMGLGQPDRALQDTDEAIVLAPDNAVAYNNRGTIYRDLGNLEQAEADLRRAIAIDPELPNPQQHLAKLLEAQAAAALHPTPV
jgi:tetratricopeptide (TPR) repeat protein